jgi:tagatose-6-phosphate ketose/aldose isomerase
MFAEPLFLTEPNMAEFEQELITWRRHVSSQVPVIAELLDATEDERTKGGYGHTIEEIVQQPVTWLDTARRAVEHRSALQSHLGRDGREAVIRSIVLTGSGSSLYAGECVAPALQSELGMPVRAIAGGDLLTHPYSAILPGRPSLLVSIARSGNSPESAGAVENLLLGEPACRHLFVTCNKQGRLAVDYREEARTYALILHERTNDRSLVMTSSFTNMVLAARFLGFLDTPSVYQETVHRLSGIAGHLLIRHAQPLAEAARDDCGFALYLASGCRFGAAREAALKMMEMSAGKTRTMVETYLGLRHGPMAAIHDDTLIICFLSGDALARAYEIDLINELNRKRLGRRKVIVGEGIPNELLRDGDVAVECPGMRQAGDDNVSVIDVLAGQLLALYHCVSLGLRPDAPSPEGIISRVVGDFQIHKPSRTHH